VVFSTVGVVASALDRVPRPGPLPGGTAGSPDR